MKAVILDLDVAKAEAMVAPWLTRTESAGSLRDKLEAFAVSEGVQL